MKIVFCGTIGRSGLGGQAWANLQYLLGLRALGHDVIYLEDCGDTTRVWDWEKKEWNYDLDYPASFVNACLTPFGFAEKWIYRTDAGSRGLPLEQFIEICHTADLLVMRAVPLWVWRKEYDGPRRRIFIDVDPGFTQINIANGDVGLAQGIGRCERRFTIGQRIGAADCPIPTVGGPWLKTMPPVFLPEWGFAEGEAEQFTSVMRWQGLREASCDNISYGQRDKEFPKFLELPAMSSQPLCLALMGTKPERLTQHGWRVLRGEVVSKTVFSYREFIQSSRAEFSVPKNGYV